MKRGSKKTTPEAAKTKEEVATAYQVPKAKDDWVMTTERGSLRFKLSPIKSRKTEVIELVLSYEQLEELQDAVAEAVRFLEDSA